jgi:hypothetical protein
MRDNLNALARERLAAGVDLYLDCFDADDEVACVFVRVRLDQALFDSLMAKRQLCIDHGLMFTQSEVTIVAHDTRYVAAADGPDDEIDRWHLRAYCDDFQFMGMHDIGQCDTEKLRTTVGCSYELLTHALNSPASDEPLPELPGGVANPYRWCGDVLVAAIEMESYLPTLRKLDPTVAAREREFLMRGAIAAGRSTVPGTPPAAQRPRTRV